jgi:hypothetical protein
MTLSRDEKLNLMQNLNWDYDVSHADMLAVIEGSLEKAGPFTRDRLFVRSLERIPWHYVVMLWGVEAIKALYTEDVARRIWPRDRRKHFDFALAILRREPVSTPGWGDEYYSSMRNRFFSNRGNSPQPRVIDLPKILDTGIQT